MKKLLLPVSLLSMMAIAMGFGIMMHEKESEEYEVTLEEKGRLAEEYFKFRYTQRADESGKFDFADYMKVAESINAKVQKGTRANITWENIGPNNVGGRTRALIVDRKNSNLLYTGGVTGGIFYSNDAGLTWKNYFNVDSRLEIFAIGSMAQAINGDIYVGTGNSSESGGTGTESSGGLGNGIYKKAANSDSFVLLTSTFNPTFSTSNPFAFVNKISTDPKDENLVFAATGNGVKISKDGGQTWINAGAPLNSGVIYSVKMNSEGTFLYAGKDGGAIYRSDDKGASWKKLASNFPAGNRIELTVCDAAPEYVYALVTTGGNLKHIIKSTDNGDSWTQIGFSDPITQMTFDPFCQNVGNNKVCQGWYDIAFEVHPKDKDKLYLGGAARFYTWSPSTGWLQAAKAGDFAGTADFIHADMHHITFDPADPNIFYIMCDGGIFRTYNAVSAFPFPNFLSKNRNYNVTQFYAFDVTRTGEVLGGAQDNGTNFVTNRESSPKTAREVSGGDGFACAMSRVNPNYHFYTVYNGKYYRSVNKGETVSSFVGGRIDGFTGSPSDGNADGVPFNTNIYLLEHQNPDPAKPETQKSFFIGSSQSTDNLSRYINYICPNPLSSGKILWLRNVTTAGYGISFSGSYDGDVLYIGRAGGGISRLSGFVNASVKYKLDGEEDSLVGITVKEYNIAGANNVWGIGVDPKDADHIVAVTGGFGGGNKVFESKNGGQTWAVKQGNLPSMPCYAAVIDALDPKKVYIGSEFGAWSTDDITATTPVWSEINIGMGRVPIFDMRQADLFENNCPVLYVASHGRGFFRSVSNTPSTCKTDVTTASINNNLISNPTLHIFPNPASDRIQAQFKANAAGQVDMVIYNINGQVAKREKVSVREGINETQLDIHALNKGNYFIRIESANKIYGGSKFVVE